MEKEKITKLLREFEKSFGFKTWEALKDYLFRMYRVIEDLERSRDNWKNKYMRLKKKYGKTAK